MIVLKDLVKNVERDLVINLTLGVRYKRITLDDSKKIAKDFISYYPFNNYEDLFERLYFLSNSYKEVRKVYVRYSPGYYEEKSNYVLGKMRDFMKVNNVEKAVKAARSSGYAKI